MTTHKRTIEWTVGFMALVLAVAGMQMGGCATDQEAQVPASGDPAADQRAQQRVGSDNGTVPEKDRTLYERLGSASGISALVDDMTARIIADPRVNFERHNVRTSVLGTKYKAWQPTPENIEVLKKHLTEFISLAAGGPATYTGRDMSVVHKSMKITNSEFDAMIGDIKVSMDNLRVASREKRDLLAVIETTRKQIVEQN